MSEAASARPRLLFLCHTLPYPPDGGPWIRTYNLLSLLSRRFDITALMFERSGGAARHHDVSGAKRALEELARVEVFPVPAMESRARDAWDHLRSLVTGRVFTVYKHDTRPFRGRLHRLLETESFDLVHLDSLDLSGLLPLPVDVPTVCVHHNVESALLRRRAAAEANPLKAWYIAHQAKLQEREERRWCGRMALNVTVSAADASLLGELVPEASVMVVPNGVDTDRFRPDPGAVEGGIVFVGGTYWFPNRDALDFFCAEILPLVRDTLPDVRVDWVGQADPDDQRRFAAEEGVRLTGYVPSIEPLVHRAACYVVPLRIGGGTRLKILDAWAMGKAVVSTSQGCEGLETRDGENILIRDDPKEFARAVVRVLSNPRLREKLGGAARSTAEELYDWRIIGQRMTTRYLSLAHGSTATVPSTVSGSPQDAVFS